MKTLPWEDEDYVLCPNCQLGIPSDWEYCPHCEEDELGEEYLLCPNCQMSVSASWSRCPMCGTSIHEKRRI